MRGDKGEDKIYQIPKSLYLETEYYREEEGKVGGKISKKYV